MEIESAVMEFLISRFLSYTRFIHIQVRENEKRKNIVSIKNKFY